MSSKKISFQGVPKCNAVNVDVIGRRRSLRLESNRKKILDEALKHVGFIHVNDASEEGIDQDKETCTFEEAISSPFKKNFLEAMIEDIGNHSIRKH